MSSLSVLARLGFEEPEAAEAGLERLGAWPPASAPGGNRLLADIAASAAPQLAARALAALADELREAAEAAGWQVEGDGVPALVIDCGGHDEDDPPLQGGPQVILCDEGPLAELDPEGSAAGFFAATPLGDLIELTRSPTTSDAAARAALGRINSVRLFGPADAAGIVSFAVEGVHPHDIGTILDESQVAIRAGHHCAQPLMDLLGVPATARASFAAHSDAEDIAALVKGLHKVKRIFG